MKKGIVTILLGSIAVWAQAADLKAGEEKAMVCVACHGPTGAGIEPAAFPRISGQHAKYTRTQLDAFRTSALIDQQASETDRASLVVRANDPNGMMRDVAEKLTPKQIEAVARYMQGLH